MATSFPKIDIFTHVLPRKYRKALYARAQRSPYPVDLQSHHNSIPALFDIELRRSILDRFEGMRQVLSITAPPLEMVVSAGDAVELAKLANEQIAELVEKYPDYFIAGVACLPMNDMDAALKEAERAIRDLNLRGVQIYTPCGGKPLDLPEFMPLYEMMAKYDLPIWLHPTRSVVTPDYAGESRSKFGVFRTVGWPYETTVAMIRIVLSGVLERHPSLSIITHHCGAMVPYFAGRLEGSLAATVQGKEFAEAGVNLSRPPIAYLKQFYGDTALSGSTAGLMCGYAFFGADHIVFGTDMPFGDAQRKLASVEQMVIPDEDKCRIFEGNAKKLLALQP